MYRKAYEDLLKWKASKNRKPLIVQGARQVGKTYLVLEFGKHEYDNVAYFNFETNPSLIDAFEGDISPDNLVPLLSSLIGKSIVRGETLIFFDEVQLCERALTSMKYFCEQASDYHVIAAGSLLGVAVNRKQFSFPVGKVDFMNLHPMDFEEFLFAIGEDDLNARICTCFDSNEPMAKPLHEKAMLLYRNYLVVGGLPECVHLFAQTEDFTLVRHAQDSILMGYMDDMSKYNTRNEIKKTHIAYNSVTAQLSKKNKRFQYKMLKKGGRASEFENAIEWLCLSGIVDRVFRVGQAKKPLSDNIDVDAFKIYLSDVGLLCARKEVVAEDVIYESKSLDEFKGGMTENYVNSQLRAHGITSYYWENDRGQEVDFLINLNNKIVPIEVKSSENTMSRSLNSYIKKYEPPYSIRVSKKNFGFENSIKSIPLYACHLIGH